MNSRRRLGMGQRLWWKQANDEAPGHTLVRRFVGERVLGIRSSTKAVALAEDGAPKLETLRHGVMLLRQGAIFGGCPLRSPRGVKPTSRAARTGFVAPTLGTCRTLYGGVMLPSWMTTTGDELAAPLERAMARFAAGDDAALGEVYDRASPAVFTFLFRLCRDRSMAEDLTQETFLRLHRARGLYRPGAAVMPWAYTISRRLFLDAVRARRSELATPGREPRAVAEGESQSQIETEVAAPGPSAESLLSDVELSKAVEDALTRIPENQATAFRLLKGEGLSVAETAVVMGTTRGAVKLRAHRAYEALRSLLAGHLSASGVGDKKNASGGGA